MTVQAAERLLHSLRKNLGPLKISIEEHWVCKESVMNFIDLAVQTCGNITEIMGLAERRPCSWYPFGEKVPGLGWLW